MDGDAGWVIRGRQRQTAGNILYVRTGEKAGWKSRLPKIARSRRTRCRDHATGSEDDGEDTYGNCAYD